MTLDLNTPFYDQVAQGSFKIIPGVIGKPQSKPSKEIITTKSDISLEVQVSRLFSSARNETFETGIDSTFSKELTRLIYRYGGEAIEQLAPILLNEEVLPELVSETLQWLGEIEHPPTYQLRLRLLERCLLFCKSAYSRDGAASGIATMDDPAAIPYMKLAIDRERIADLRDDLEQVLQQLEDTLQEG